MYHPTLLLPSYHHFRSSSSSSSLSYSLLAPGLQVLPFPRDEEQKMDDYFVQKLLNVTENNR